MKVAQAQAERYLRSLDAGVRAVLLHGPDSGLVRELALAAVAKVLEDPDDPFRLADLTGAEVAEDPARLFDEAASLSLSGGRRVVRVRGAGEAQSAVFKDFLETLPGEALVVVEAGDIGGRAKLVAAFEKAGPEAAAIGCYRDEAASLARVISESLAAEGLKGAPDALSYLSTNLGGDRQLTRRELEKLALYMGDAPGSADGHQNPRELSLADAVACVGDSAALSMEDLAFAVAGADPKASDRALRRSLQEGASSVAALRAVSRHFQRLHFVSGHAAAGGGLETAMKKLRPPVFWKAQAAFKAQAAAWPPSWLGRALERLLEAERACKTTGARDQAICSEVLLSIAQKAPKSGRRGP